VGYIKTHILLPPPPPPPPPENRAVVHMVEPDRLQRNSGIDITHCFSTATLVARMCLSANVYTYIACINLGNGIPNCTATWGAGIVSLQSDTCEHAGTACSVSQLVDYCVSHIALRSSVIKWILLERPLLIKQMLVIVHGICV